MLLSSPAAKVNKSLHNHLQQMCVGLAGVFSPTQRGVITPLNNSTHTYAHRIHNIAAGSREVMRVNRHVHQLGRSQKHQSAARDATPLSARQTFNMTFPLSLQTRRSE